MIMVSTFIKSEFSPAVRPEEKREYFCTDCQFEVQISTKHCNQCGCCIDKFDHHCVWLNLCIGKRNYRLFVATVIVEAVVILYIFVYGMAVVRPRLDDDEIQRDFQVVKVHSGSVQEKHTWDFHNEHNHRRNSSNSSGAAVVFPSVSANKRDDNLRIYHKKQSQANKQAGINSFSELHKADH